ncbi:MAG: gliding motility-associated ABC transporter substrate-binding protein GldG [Flavobacteriales bacterium]|nr:gliding motility-associated ABC transporter substrate-binding protein GldG [Flavobacteriales bacterium]
MNKKSNLLFLILIIMIINIVSSYIPYKIDLTNEKRFTLSEASIDVLNRIDDKLTIKIYLKGNLPSGFQLLGSSINSFIINCKKLNNNIDFEFIDPNKADNEEQKKSIYKQLQDQGLYPTDLTIKKSDETSRRVIFPGAIIYYKEKREAVNLLENNSGLSPQININNSIENIEFQIVSTINKLIKNNRQNVGFLKGNGELSSDQLLDITESVNNDNNNLKNYYNVGDFNLKEFEIDSTTNEPNISKQLEELNRFDVIIIAKPTIPFNKLDKFLIDQYIMHGGKILLLMDGVNASIDSINNKNGYFIASENNLNIDDQLFKYGIRINNDLIQDLRATEIPIVTGYSNNQPIQDFFKWPYYPLLSSNSDHPISKNIDALKCDFVSSIDTLKNDIHKTIILESSKRSRKVQSPVKVSLSILENPPPSETFNKPNIPVGVLLSGRFTSVFKDRIVPKDKSLDFKEKSDSTKLIIVSDGDIIANDVSQNKGTYPLGYDKFINYTYQGNKKFILNSIQFLCDDNGLIKLRSKNIRLRLLNSELISDNKSIIILINTLIPIIVFLLLILIVNTFNRLKYD